MMRTTTTSLLLAAFMLAAAGCDTAFYEGSPPVIGDLSRNYQLSLAGCEHVAIAVDDLEQCSTPVVTFGNRNAAVLQMCETGPECTGDPVQDTIVIYGQDLDYWELRCHLDTIDLVEGSLNVITPPGPVAGGAVDVQVACEGGVGLVADAFVYPDGRMTAEGRDLHQDEVSGLALMWSDGPFINVPYAYGYGFVHEQPVPRQSIFLASDHDAVARREGIRPQTPPAAFELPEGADRLKIGETIELYHVRDHYGQEGPMGNRICTEPVCNYVGDPTDLSDTNMVFLVVEYERPEGEACHAGAYGRDEASGEPFPDEDTCDDGIDNDGDGTVDENDISCGYYWGSGDASDTAPLTCERYYHVHTNLRSGESEFGLDLAPNELPLDFSNWTGVYRPLGSPPYETQLASLNDLDEEGQTVGIELPSGPYRARLVRGSSSEYWGIPIDLYDPFELELEYFDALEIELGTTSVFLPEEAVFAYKWEDDVHYYENFDTGGENVAPLNTELFVRADGATAFGVSIDGFDTDADGDGHADPWEYVVTVPPSEEGDPQIGTGFPWAMDLYYSFPKYIDKKKYQGVTMDAGDWDTFETADLWASGPMGSGINPDVENACKGFPIYWEDRCGETPGERETCFDGQDNDGNDMVDDADSACFCKDDFVTGILEVMEPAIPYMGMGYTYTYRLVAHAWAYEERMCFPPEALAALPDLGPNISADADEIYTLSPWGFIALNKHRMNPIPLEELGGNMIVDAQHGYSAYFFTVTNCEDGVDNDGDGTLDCDDVDCAETIACMDKDPETIATLEELEDYFWFYESPRLPRCSDNKDNDGDGWVDFVEDDLLTEDYDESLFGDPGCDSLEDTSEDNDDLGPCADGIDNDGDGETDGNDPQCADETGDGWAAGSENPQCSNEIDDDGDGLIDEDDPNCLDMDGVYDPEDNLEETTECEDLVDNDGDGWVDWADPDCYELETGGETGINMATWPCADGADNDGDGYIDGLDLGCTDAEDFSETDPDASCLDGIDNDADGWIDLADPTCLEDLPEEPGGQGTDYECHNGLDDDGDGLFDGYDPDCVDPYDDTELAEGCADGLDNDGDGWIDQEDPDCFFYETTDEQGWFVSSWVCGDGDDNDGDGLIDGNDPGCENAEDGDEEDPDPSCMDGVDNDGDGWVDSADPSCPVDGAEDPGGFGTNECNDGVDNDGDTFVDSADPGCADAYDTEEAEPNCTDSLDNDDDCYVDAADPDCAEFGSDYESGQSLGTECGNHIDDDSDGFIDGCDPECTDYWDNDEAN